jgi:hypothetical protein
MRLIALLLFFFIKLNSFAQQCAYDHYYMFAINVHSKNSNQKIPNLKLYLTDENGKASTAEVRYLKNKIWTSRLDTLFFWDNEFRIKKDGSVPLVRRNFYTIGNWYVVVFRMENADLKNPLKQPFYKVKIEAGENEITGTNTEQSFYLPIKKSVRLCNSGVLENFKLSIPIQSIDGNNFQPIDITLDEYPSPGVVGVAEIEPFNTYLKYIIRPEFETSINTAAHNRKEFKVKEVNIYDVDNGKLHQQIETPSKVITSFTAPNRLIDTGNFYQRTIKEAVDFSLIMEEWRDTVFNVERKKTHFYVFNTVTKLYEPDTFLNKESDVYFYKPLQKFRRLEYVVTEKSKIINTYQLENKQWKLIDKREELLPAFKPKPKYSPAACVVFNEKNHRLPLKAVIGTNATITVKDSFLLYNYCEDTIKIISVKSQHRDFFSISQLLPPKQYTKLSFEGIIRNSSFDFWRSSYACYLTLEDSTILSFGIDIPTISNNSKVVYRTDSSIDYAIAQRNDSRFNKAIFTYPDGNIRAMGMVKGNDTSFKTGKWQYYQTGDWKITEVVYSKSITLSALNQSINYGNADFKIKVLENGIWKEQELNVYTLYITEKTDSIVAYNDSLSYGFRLPYSKLTENINIQFYLLKPGERTLKIGYYKTPFQTLQDQYAIIPDFSKIKNKNQSYDQVVDSIIASFKKQFPQTMPIVVSRNVRGISLEFLSIFEKRLALKALVNMPAISLVTQLFTITDKQIPTHCNNNVYVELNGNNPDSLRETALSLGFKNMRADMGNNRYWLTYDTKLVDETFFEAYKKLTESPLVLSAYFDSYMEVGLD